MSRSRTITKTTLLSALALGHVLAVSGCGGQDHPTLDSVSGGGNALPPVGIGGNGTGGGGSGSGTALLRLAHLSPDAGNLDLCVRTTGTAGWPAGMEFQPLGQPSGLAYPGVSNYIRVPAGVPIDIRAAAGGSDCTTPNKVADDDSVGPFVDGKYYTVSMIGLRLGGTAGQALSLAVFKDDVASDPLTAKVRFIHGAPGLLGAVDVVRERGRNDPQPTPLFSSVSYGDIALSSTPGNNAISAKGYAALGGDFGDLGVRTVQNGSPAALDSVYYGGAVFSIGGTYTVFAIGTATPRVLVCTDTEAAASTTFAARCAKSP
jgi:hypothetical protein